MKQLYKRLINDISSYMMTTKELERKYDLHLGDHTINSSEYWSWKVEHRTRPSEFWAKVSKNPNLTYNFIKLYKEFLFWDILVYDKFYQDINFIHEFAEWIDWWKFSQKFVEINDESTIREFIDFIDFDKKYDHFNWNITLNFMREFNDKIHWVDTENRKLHTIDVLKNTKVCDEYANEILSICYNKNIIHKFEFFSHLKFSKKMFLRFIQPHTISQLLYYDILDEEILEEYIIPKHKDNKEIMLIMFEHETITEQFIEKYKDIIDKFQLWSNVSRYQHLSEQFIDKYKKNVNWCNIIKFQNISEKFIEEHLIYIKKNMKVLIQNKNLSIEFIERNIKWLNISSLVHHQILSENIINKYLNNNPYLKDIALQKRRGEIYNVV